MNDLLIVTYKEYEAIGDEFLHQQNSLWVLINHENTLARWQLYHTHPANLYIGFWGVTTKKIYQCRTCKKRVPKRVKLTYLLLRN